MLDNHAVELRSVSKRFTEPGGGHFEAVQQVSLEIRSGEFFSLLGSSGCGKTTSLRMIAGFELPTSGEIIIQGRSMGRTPPYQRPVNTVFQSYALFQHLNVAQNVAFGLEMEKRPKVEITRRVGEALEMVKLGGLGDRKPRQLSGGQQQRVALARALVKRPAVLLLDEPLGALDLKLRQEMQLELKALQEQVGITFVYVTHDQEEALTMSDRIAVMDKGRVLQIGKPVEIYERPNCRFVADFIGQSNFLNAVVRRLEGEWAWVYSPALESELRARAVGGLIPGQAVSLAIRPEKIHLSDQAPAADNSFKVRVAQVAYIGSDTELFIEMPGGLRLAAWEQNKISTLNPNEYYERGDETWATLAAGNLLALPDTPELPLAEVAA